MICLSSAAVVRLARAGDAWKKLNATTVDGSSYQALPIATPHVGSPHNPIITRDPGFTEATRQELIDAAMAVADEAIAMGHHEREGD